MKDTSVSMKELASDKQENNIVYHVYKERWVIATVCALLQVTNGALWINFASIANYSREYFDVDTDAINWLSLVYFVTFGPFVFIAMWVVNKYGFKIGLYFACFFNVVGSLLRDFGTYPFVPNSYRYHISLAGQTVASIVFPILTTLPTKVSQDWFAENERTISTTIISMASPLGSALGSFIPTLIVKAEDDVPLMNHIFCGCAIVTGLLGIFCRHEKPATPPSNTSQQLEEMNLRKPFFTELKTIFTNVRFMIFVFGSGAMTIGIPSAFSSVMQQMLYPWGYSNTSVGLCTGLMIGSSIPGSVLFTYLADKTKKLEEIIKICFGLLVSAHAAFVLCMQLDILTGELLLPILCVIVGILGTGVLSICLEVSVEDTYPVDESITAGLIILLGQVQAAVYVPIMTSLSRALTLEQQQRQTFNSDEHSEAYDMTYSGLFIICIGTVCSITTTLIYWPKFKRMEAEKLKLENYNLQKGSTGNL
ncbi:Major facilitator super domain-containing protein 7 [Chamberlinius hualienensis]